MKEQIQEGRTLIKKCVNKQRTIATATNVILCIHHDQAKTRAVQNISSVFIVLGSVSFKTSDSVRNAELVWMHSSRLGLQNDTHCVCGMVFEVRFGF